MTCFPREYAFNARKFANILHVLQGVRTSVPGHSLMEVNIREESDTVS